MIDLNNVCFSYAGSIDGEGVKNFNLHVCKGEFVVLTGESGSGKTTVARIINGLAPAFYEGQLTGKVILNGKDASTLSMWERSTIVGSVFQDPRSQFFSPQVEGEIAFGCENLGFDYDSIHQRVDRAIEDMEMQGLKGRSLLHLSSGEKQKVAITSIRAVGPQIYIFDEPSSNLDTEAAIQLGLLMKKLKEEGCTVVVSEHRIWYLMNLADRFLYLKDGCIDIQMSAGEMNQLPSVTLKNMGIRSRELVPCVLEEKEYGHRKPSGTELAACEISFRYKKEEVLHGFSIEAYGGEIIAVTGCNGTGKTTLAKILCGLYKPNKGVIRLNGKDVNQKQRMKQIRFIPHDTASGLFAESVRGELLLMLDKTEAAFSKADGLLRTFGLYEYKERHPATLSGGQKQRLVLAAALMEDAQIMILDEPTSGLDAQNMCLVAGAMKHAAALGKSILIITHDGELIHECCTRVVQIP